MVFNSYLFFLLLPALLALYRVLSSWRHRKYLLLVASYLFYAAWHPPFIALLALSTIVDWTVGRALGAEERRGRRRLWLLVSLGVNLGMLSYFKYAGLAISTVEDGLLALGVGINFPDVHILLPVGISFYTFQTLSYTIDIYRREMKPWGCFSDFALFVSFFPQLVAGPIVRASDFQAQCETPRYFSLRGIEIGMTLLFLGLFQKVVLADGLLALPADQVFNNAATLGFVDSWTGTLAFAGQIYFDFAGYSICAIGVAAMFGFVLPMNFNAPYAALGFSDFWRRWHISLSTWLRDYLYIPLGGNRSGKILRYRNLVLTMLLGGLWHGASWRFVVWGALHGALLVLERVVVWVWPNSMLPSWTRTPTAFVAGAATFFFVCLTWVFFRAASFGDAADVLTAMFSPQRPSSLLSASFVILVAAVMMVTLVLQVAFRQRPFAEFLLARGRSVRALVLFCFLIGIALAPSSDRAFIYFQF